MTEREELEMWKSMYLRLLRGTEDAINTLVQSEQATEDLYIETGLSEAQYASDTIDTKQWRPITTIGKPEEISFARVFRLSKADLAEAEHRAAGDRAEQEPKL